LIIDDINYCCKENKEIKEVKKIVAINQIKTIKGKTMAIKKIKKIMVWIVLESLQEWISVISVKLPIAKLRR